MSSSQFFLRMPELTHRTGLGRSTIYRMIRNGTFPKSVHLGARSVAWLATEVDEWSRARVSDRDHESRKSKKLKDHQSD